MRVKDDRAGHAKRAANLSVNAELLEQAKALCADCPIRLQCLSEALEREEPWGVWGGEILERGAVIARKRPRGRPLKDVVAA